ncbi:MAG TPA: nitrogenase component 1 [Polyangiaceae bacterium]|nr:nitrogenase component 1 [Polyangiaceae bacterium]
MSGATFIEKPRASCALGGALATVNALPRTVPILHASVGCGGMTSVSVLGASGYLGSGYCGGNSIPASAIGEQEVVFGGSERLVEQMRNTAEIIDAELFAVITGCTAEIIGDDVPAVVRDYNEKRNDRAPAIHISGAGFKGDSLWGYDVALESLFRNFVTKSTERVKGQVNIWGIPPAQDVWWHGNLIELRRLLEGLGLKVNTFFTAKDELEEIRKSANAELNIVVSPVHGIAAARAFQEVHGTPYVSTDLPIGAKATRKFMLDLAEKLQLDVVKVERYLSEQEALYYHVFNRMADAYSDIDLQRYAVVIGNIDYAHALTRFVNQELGWLTELIVVTDQLEKGEEPALRKRFADFVDDADKKVVFDTDTSRIAGHFEERWPRPNGNRYHHAFSPAFVLGSRLDRDFAESIGAGHLSVSYPVSNRLVLGRGYAGLNGALTLVEDIYTVVLAAR